MKDIDLKIITIVLAVCFSIGGLISHYTILHWLPAGLMVLAGLLIFGCVVSVEDRQPDGWDHVGNDKPISESDYKKMIRVQILCASITSCLAVITFVLTSN